MALFFNGKGMSKKYKSNYKCKKSTWFQSSNNRCRVFPPFAMPPLVLALAISTRLTPPPP